MRPVEFEGQNKVFGKPEGMSDEECSPLPVWVGDLYLGPEKTPYVNVVSCWEFEEQDWENIKKNGGRIFLSCTGGQPPVMLTTERPF